MDDPVRVAWCNILFASNGGEFDQTGLPILKEEIIGKCDKAYDCGTCPLLTQWVNERVQSGWSVGWECYKCLTDSKKHDQEVGDRHLPGYYQAGRDPSVDPFNGQLVDDFDNQDEDNPPLKGCTNCGWSTSFLQLVLRKPKGGP